MTDNKNNISSGIMSHFPLPTARASQKVVIEEIDKVFKSGKRIVILEAPVGSGKSAIALTLARSVGPANLTIEPEGGVGGSHIITPLKSLQDQYYSDFHEHIVLMKGRNAYPCTFDAKPRKYAAVINAIEAGSVKAPLPEDINCANAPCKDSLAVFNLCTEDRPCPYSVAIKVASNNPIIIHNIHSFIFQTNFGNKFGKRELLIVDEAHEIENTIRDFITKKLALNGYIKQEELSNIKSVSDWHTFLMNPRFIPEETEQDRAKKDVDKAYVSAKEDYLRKVEALTAKDYFDKGFSVDVNYLYKPNAAIPYATVFEFIPHHVGAATNNLLLDYGTKVLLMSGTIYEKDLFCRNLGINPADAHFIRTSSSFPKENRPLYLKPQYQTNTSHLTWNENFPELIKIIQKIMDIFKDAKGLIHAPSYAAAEQIKNALNSSRAVTHTSSDFLDSLEQFFASKDPNVFISPTCQQGVDFKADRARFQIIVRVPYTSTNSVFIKDKVEKDFPWYNYQALVVFGQQLGRVNRSEDDYGATFLIDSRFNKFITRNSRLLPGWVKEAFVWK